MKIIKFYTSNPKIFLSQTRINFNSNKARLIFNGLDNQIDLKLGEIEINFPVV